MHGRENVPATVSCHCYAAPGSGSIVGLMSIHWRARNETNEDENGFSLFTNVSTRIRCICIAPYRTFKYCSTPPKTTNTVGPCQGGVTPISPIIQSLTHSIINHPFTNHPTVHHSSSSSSNQSNHPISPFIWAVVLPGPLQHLQVTPPSRLRTPLIMQSSNHPVIQSSNQSSSSRPISTRRLTASS